MQMSGPPKTVLERLERGRIFSVTRRVEGFEFQEECDQNFCEVLTRDDVRRLAEELLLMLANIDPRDAS